MIPCSASVPQTKNAILWAAYLACSWTWCIGMFIPAILMRDMGWIGFIIFALPNIIGAGAMGWVLRSKLQSKQFVEKHPQATWWFSVITVGFHLFWILWVARFFRSAFQMPNSYLATVGGILLLFILFSGRIIKRGQAPHLAVGVLTLSITVLIATFFTSDLDAPNARLMAAPSTDLAPLWMLPVMVFGFAFCPYLDITFHHARQQLDTPKEGRLGFTLGFGLFFALMILLTTRYAGLLYGAISNQTVPAIAPWLAAGLLLHILCQWVYTVRVHLDQMADIPTQKIQQPLLYITLILSGLAGFFATSIPSYANLLGGEIIYRCFMSAYGLIFPAYILYRVLTPKKNTRFPSILWIMIGVAFPLFWMGFIERQPVWLIPGLGLVVAGALLKRSKK